MGYGTTRWRNQHSSGLFVGKARPKTIRCRTCHKQKPWTDRFFHKAQNGKPGWRGLMRICKKCYHARTTPAAARAHHLFYTYGITPAEYNTQLKKQKGRCAICRQKPTRSRWKRLHVDHRHTPGERKHRGATHPKEVRGLLCYQCNLLLAVAKETIKVLRAAIRYLEKYDCKNY